MKTNKWCVLVVALLLMVGLAHQADATVRSGRIYWTTRSDGIETAIYNVDPGGTLNVIPVPGLPVLTGKGVDAGFFDPTGTDIIAGAMDHIVRVPTTGGPPMDISPPGSNTQAEHVALDPSGLYVWSSKSFGPSVITPDVIEQTDISTGAVTQFNVTLAGSGGSVSVPVSGLAFVDEDGPGGNPPVLFITDNDSTIYALDLGTFEATPVGTVSPGSAHGLTWNGNLGVLFIFGSNVATQALVAGGVVNVIAVYVFTPEVVLDEMRQVGLHHIFLTNVDPVGGHQLMLLDLQTDTQIDGPSVTESRVPVPDIDDVIPFEGEGGPSSGPRAHVQPRKVDFGFVAVEDSSELCFWITNLGDQFLSVYDVTLPNLPQYDITGVDRFNADGSLNSTGTHGDFFPASSPSEQLAPGESYKIYVEFTPQPGDEDQDFPDTLAVNIDFGNELIPVELCATTNAPPVELMVVAGDTFVEPGEDGVKMPITLINPGSSPAGGLQFELDFSSVVHSTVTDIIIDPVLGGLGFELKTNIDDGGSFNGILGVVIFNLNGAVIDPGEQVVAWICFTADDIPPVPGPLGTEDLVGVGSVIVSDEFGGLIGSSGEDGLIQIGIPGDVNLDGVIDIRDVVVLINAILISGPQVPDLSNPDGVDFKIADLNGDGDVNVADVIGQVNHILGLPLDDGVSPKAVTSSPIVVDLGSAVSQNNGQLAIPVLLETSDLIAGAQATFTFDPSILTVGTPELVGNASNLLINSSVSGGTLRVVAVSLAKDQGLSTGTTPILLIPVTLRDDDEAALTLTELTLVNRQAQVVPVTMGTSTVAVTKDGAVVPTTFALHANRPNPFNPSTTIAYDVPQQAHITLTVYNLLGQEVIRLVDQMQSPGRYTVTWHGTNAQGQVVATGVYMYRLTSSTGYGQTKRMTLLK